MKPEYWIGLLALIGGLLGYIISRSTGWYGTVVGVVLGILVGAIYYMVKRLQKK